MDVGADPLRRLSTEELMLSNWLLEKTFESPLDCKEIKSVNPKGSPEYTLEGLMLKLQYFDYFI